MPSYQPIEHTIEHEMTVGFFQIYPESDYAIELFRNEGINRIFLNEKYVKCNNGMCHAMFEKVAINHEEEPEKIVLIPVDENGNRDMSRTAKGILHSRVTGVRYD